LRKTLVPHYAHISEESSLSFRLYYLTLDPLDASEDSIEGFLIEEIKDLISSVEKEILKEKKRANKKKKASDNFSLVKKKKVRI
jgi:hypothetical protein